MAMNKGRGKSCRMGDKQWSLTAFVQGQQETSYSPIQLNVSINVLNTLSMYSKNIICF